MTLLPMWLLGGRLKALRREVADVKAGQAKLEAGQPKAEVEAEARQADAKANMEARRQTWRT